MPQEHPPLKGDRLDQIEGMLQHTEDEMLVSAYHTRKEDTWIRASDIRSMIAELRRRRHKMGYKEK